MDRVRCAALLASAFSFACGSSSSPAPKPNLEGLVVIERAPGARYVIDTRSEVCLLMIDHAITTRVDCRTLEKNVSKAKKHLTWLKAAEPTKPPALPRSRTTHPWGVATPSTGIQQTGPDRYEIDRAFLDAVLQNPSSAAKGARIVPSVKNGRPNGFKLYAIRPDSIYAKLGLQNGVTINRINGEEIGSPDKAIALYAKLKSSSHFVFEMTYRGKPRTMTLTIVGQRQAGSAHFLPQSISLDKMREATDAYDRKDYERAQELALAVLAINDRNVRMLRLVISTACILGDSNRAKKYYGRLPRRDQRHMKVRCGRYGVQLDK